MLGGGFKYYFLFLPPDGEDSHFDEYFSNRLKPPTGHSVSAKKLYESYFWLPFFCGDDGSSMRMGGNLNYTSMAIL